MQTWMTHNGLAVVATECAEHHTHTHTRQKQAEMVYLA